MWLSSLWVLQTTLEDIVNEPSMIKKGEKLTKIELNPPKPENVRYLQSADTRTSCLFGPLNDNVVDCKRALYHKKWLKIDWPRVPAHHNRKYKISLECRNVNLSSLRVLQTTLEDIVNEPSTIQKGENVVDCKRALDHKKRLKIDWPRVPAHQSRKCQISLERGDMNLSSLLDLQTTAKCAVNEPLTKENDGELMKIEYTLLLKHSMTDICKIQWQMPLVSSGPKTDSKYLVINFYLVENGDTECNHTLLKMRILAFLPINPCSST